MTDNNIAPDRGTGLELEMLPGHCTLNANCSSGMGLMQRTSFTVWLYVMNKVSSSSSSSFFLLNWQPAKQEDTHDFTIKIHPTRHILGAM